MKGTNTGIRMTLVKANEWNGTDGRRHLREEWTITGGEIDPAWRRGEAERAAGWEPSSRFTLYVVDGEVDPHLASYGGVRHGTHVPLRRALRRLGHVRGRESAMNASIKVTLYSDEGRTPTIVSSAASREDAARIEWLVLVGTAEHLLRNHRERLLEPQLAALKTLLAAQGEP